MKRLLILTCNTGMGHNSSAAAVKEQAEISGWETETVDALSFLSERASEFISSMHVRLYRHAPIIFDKGYTIAESITDLGEEGGLFSKIMGSGSRKLCDMLLENRYDAALAAHNFAATMLTEAMRLGAPSIPTGFVATDYTCAPSTKGCGTDFVFIPHESLVPSFLAQDIEKKRIVVSGIPIRSRFLHHVPKSDARKALGIPEGRPHILMMCGSMGCGPIEEICEYLSARLPGGSRVTVVCGTNEKLLQSLKKKKLPWIEPIGFTDDIPLLMDSADLFLTKPGGISITEAAAKALPMVFIDAVGGCEDYNLRFFTSLGCAECGETPEETANICCRLLAKEDMLAAMGDNLRREINIKGAEIIFSTLSEAANDDKERSRTL